MHRCSPVAAVLVVLLVAAACAADEREDLQQVEDEAPAQAEDQAPAAEAETPASAEEEASQGAVDEPAADSGVLVEPASLVLEELPGEAAVAASAREIRVSWPEAEPVAGSAVAGYEVQWRSGDQDWDVERRRVVIGLSYAIRGLDDGVSYTVRVRPAAVEVAEVRGASIVAGEGSAPTAEVVADPAPVNPNVHQSVLPMAGAVNFEMTGEPVWPATIILPVDLDLIGDDDVVQVMFYNESLDLWVPSPGAVLDRERGVITAEVYHLSVGGAFKCLLSLWSCKPVTDAIGTGVQAVQQQVERVSRLLSQHWDEATGWLREGWSRAGEFVFGDLPELARQVLDRATRSGRMMATWVRAWLEAAAELGTEWFKTMTIKRLGYGIDPPSCVGGRPDWAAPSRLVPDKDIMLHCDDTASDRDDGRDDLLLKLTANRTYGLTVRSGDERANIGYPSPENISVEHMDIASDLEDLLSGATISLGTDSIVIPPGGTASLRIPLSSLSHQADRGDQTKSSTELTYSADALSLVLQALLLAVDLAGGRTSQLLSGFKCAVAAVAGSANADQSDDRRAWMDVVAGVVDDCLLPAIPAVGNLTLAIGGIVLLHETQRMIADDAWSDDHRIIAESKWITHPDNGTDDPSTGTAFFKRSLLAGVIPAGCARMRPSSAGVTTLGGRRKRPRAPSEPSPAVWVIPAGCARMRPSSAGVTTVRGRRKRPRAPSEPSPAVWVIPAGCARMRPSSAGVTTVRGRRKRPRAPSQLSLLVWVIPAGCARMRPSSAGVTTVRGQAEAPAGTFTAVAAGVGHSCGLRTDETIVCWGRDSASGSDYAEPGGSGPGGSFKAVSAGRHSCGLLNDDTIVCWIPWESPVAPAGSFKAVSAGGSHSCGLRTDDTIICWSDNYNWPYSYLGWAEAPGSSFTAVTAGFGTPADCAQTTPSSAGAAILLRAAITQVRPEAASQRSPPAGVIPAGCARMRPSSCWGDNDYGETDAPAGTFKAVAAGVGHSCGLRADETVVCWGINDYGETDAPAGSFKAVSAGVGHSCGLRIDDTIICWGRNVWGQAEAPAGTFKAVAAGVGHSCGLRADETVVCWGNNDYGQTEAPAGAFKSVTASSSHSCGLRTDDTIICWGNNDYGQTDAPAGTFVAVTASTQRSCGLRSDGVIICWGVGVEDIRG